MGCKLFSEYARHTLLYSMGKTFNQRVVFNGNGRIRLDFF